MSDSHPATSSLQALENAYLALLQMPHDAVRLKHQGTLCLLRDAIAAESGLTARQVQEGFEEEVLKARLSETRQMVPVVRTCDDCGADIYVRSEEK